MSKFTRQCNCPEIQDGWEPKVGDWTEHSAIIKVGYYSDGMHITTETTDGPRLCLAFIWLPSETDLWTMLPKKKLQVVALGRLTMGWRLTITTVVKDIDFDAKTAQQALIQGVMWELHSKKWDNEKGWVR